MGETSGVALRALSIGTPLVVSDVGWFAELPDAAAIKVPVGEGEIEALETAMRLLASDGARRDAMARAGRGLAEGEHAVDRVADLYAAACEELAGAATVQTALVEHIAPAAADVGIGAEELRDIATAMSEVTRDG
jgi:hypothetical protein